MTVKLIDFINTLEYNEKIDLYDENDNILFLGRKIDLLKELYTSQILATKTISKVMIINSIMDITIK